MASLEQAFDEAMMQIYRRAKDEAGYTATVFHQMLTKRRGVQTAKALINAPKPSDGYTALYMRQRLDLTVEAVIVEDAQWHALFTDDELERARRRLRDYQYQIRTRPDVS